MLAVSRRVMNDRYGIYLSQNIIQTMTVSNIVDRQTLL